MVLQRGFALLPQEASLLTVDALLLPRPRGTGIQEAARFGASRPAPLPPRDQREHLRSRHKGIGGIHSLNLNGELLFSTKKGTRLVAVVWW